MNMIFEGNVAWVYPDHFDVDLIIGMQNTRENDISKLIPIAMNAFEKGFSKKVALGDFLVGGRNFGYGHAHRQCMETIRQIGINTILAESFAPGFFRAEVGNGMALLVVPEISKKAARGNHLIVDFENGAVRNETTGETIAGDKPRGVIVDLVRNGGNSGFLKEKIADAAFD
jgi:3-isopropylmalate/(R)-2-methylmalate dehydratase small subunit